MRGGEGAAIARSRHARELSRHADANNQRVEAVRREFPDVGSDCSAGDLCALVELAFEQLLDNPDFADLRGVLS